MKPKVKVLFFARLREVVGSHELSLSLEIPASISQLLDTLEQNYPALKEMRPIIRVGVNQEYVLEDIELKDGDEIALIPPVSGG